ncbi:MAG: hypothetical protein IKE55_11240 [Kiritimatiellae bacterium]|nr:hypothetical protein [Kiritimatiellia bacterium]
MKKKVFFAGVVLSGGLIATAAEPIALWDNRFVSLTDGNVTMNLNGNTLSSDSSSICVDGTKGVQLNWNSAGMRAVTVYVKYSGFAMPTSNAGMLAGLWCYNYGLQERPGLTVKSTTPNVAGTWWDNGVSLWAVDQSSYNLAQFAVGDGTGTFAITYNPGGSGNDRGLKLFQRQNGTWTLVYEASGLVAGGDANNNIRGAAVGGIGWGPLKSGAAITTMPNLTINAIAVFNSALPKTELEAYVLPSEAPSPMVSLTASGSPYVWSQLQWQYGKPTSEDYVEIVIDGDVTLQMDESSDVFQMVTVSGTGSLKLTDEGLLSMANFASSVPITLATGTGDTTFAAGLNLAGTTKLGNGQVFVTGEQKSTGISSGGGLHLTSGALLLRGDETYTGITTVEAEAAVITTNGTLGVGGFTGPGTVCFRTELPDSSTRAFMKSQAWTGTCRLENIRVDNAPFNADDFGHAGSKVCLAGFSGYLYKEGPSHLTELVLARVALDGTLLDPALDIMSGYSNGDYPFGKLSGYGYVRDSSNPTQAYHVSDPSDFHGSVVMKNKRFVFGTGAAKGNGTIYVSPGVVMDCAADGTNYNAAGWFYAPNGIYIDGSLTMPTLHHFVGGASLTIAPVHVGSTGRIRSAMTTTFVTRWGGAFSSDDFSTIDGTGTLEFSDLGTGASFSLPTASQRMWTNSLAVANNQGNGTTGGILIPVKGTSAAPAVTDIGTLSGTGMFRSDNSSDAAAAKDRILRVTQASDSTWSGTFGGAKDNIAALSVAGTGPTTTCTLTLAGCVTNFTQRLDIEASGSVLLDGTWKGDINVAGSFGGSGTNVAGTVTFAGDVVFDGRSGAFHAEAVNIGTLTSVGVRYASVPRIAVKVLEGPVSGATGTMPATLTTSDGRQHRAEVEITSDGVYLLPRGFIIMF